MRPQKTTTLLLASFMWLLMVQDYRTIKQDTWKTRGYVSTGLWYKTKQECEEEAGKSNIKYGTRLCVKSNPTK
jgi:hypothetical protein